MDSPGIFAQSPAQRNAKTIKMASYLSGTREKVDALVRAAQAEGVNGVIVEVVRLFGMHAWLYQIVMHQAMKPVLDAVEHALAFHRARNSAKAPPK